MTYVIRNEDVKRVLIGVPKGHKHLRICLKLKEKTIIFQEATIANIVRGYVTIKTHPKVRALELEMKTLPETQRKEEYAKHQLLEVQRREYEIEEEIRKLLEIARPF
jgi:hypothetical protein